MHLPLVIFLTKDGLFVFYTLINCITQVLLAQKPVLCKLIQQPHALYRAPQSNKLQNSTREDCSVLTPSGPGQAWAHTAVSSRTYTHPLSSKVCPSQDLTSSVENTGLSLKTWTQTGWAGGNNKARFLRKCAFSGGVCTVRSFSQYSRSLWRLMTTFDSVTQTMQQDSTRCIPHISFSAFLFSFWV